MKKESQKGKVHIKNLKEYCRIDRENIVYEGDFGEFCKRHIEDIEAVLKELELKDEVIEEMTKIIHDSYRNIGVLNTLMEKKICIKLINPKDEESDCYFDLYNEFCKEHIKDYFIDKVKLQSNKQSQ